LHPDSPTPPYMYNPPPQKKRRIWLWVLIPVVLFAVVCLGGIAVVTAIGNEMANQEKAKTAAVKIKRCENRQLGVEIRYTINNDTGYAQNYRVQFEVKDGNGERLADAYAIHNNLAAGQSLEETAHTLKKAPDTFTCSIVKVD
jgi:hypothetical protein